MQKCKCQTPNLQFSGFCKHGKELGDCKKHKEIKILLGLHPEEVIKMQKDEIEEAFEFIEKYNRMYRH